MSIVQADLYPSRQHTSPSWQERMDPVVYRDDLQNAPLRPEQLSRFKRDGFLVLPEVFTKAE